MSYDISLIKNRKLYNKWKNWPKGEWFTIEDEEKFYIDYSDVAGTNGGFINITSNLAEMFSVLPVGYLPELTGLKAANIKDRVQDSLTELQKYPEKYKKYEASNGWGTVSGAANFLHELLNLCNVKPDGIIVVGY